MMQFDDNLNTKAPEHTSKSKVANQRSAIAEHLANTWILSRLTNAANSVNNSMTVPFKPDLHLTSTASHISSVLLVTLFTLSGTTILLSGIVKQSK